MPQVQPAPVSPAGAPTPSVQTPSAQVPSNFVPEVKEHNGVLKIVLIVILSLTTVTFLGLFIWIFVQYNDINSDVTGKIDDAVAAAKMDQAQKDEAEFAEREKDPYRSFSGPVDYGQLTFEYPKTWSVYVAADAANGGNFVAYFNPIQVSAGEITALSVVISTNSFDSVTAEYQNYMERKDSNLTMTSVTFNGITANKYSGTIPNTDLNGYVVIFKIRDKTAILQTDSVLFEGDFNKVLDTVKFNA